MCPAEVPIPDANNICRTCAEVNPEKPFWDGFQCLACSESLDGEFFDGLKCVKACSESFVVEAGNKICKRCADIDPARPLWKDGKCQACPEGQYFFDSKCAAGCPICCSQYYQCTYNPSPFYCSELERINYLKPLFGQVCVQRCGKFQTLEDGKCVCNPKLRQI